MLREKHINVENIQKDLAIDSVYLTDANMDVVKSYYIGKLTFNEMTGLLKSSVGQEKIMNTTI